MMLAEMRAAPETRLRALDPALPTRVAVGNGHPTGPALPQQTSGSIRLRPRDTFTTTSLREVQTPTPPADPAPAWPAAPAPPSGGIPPPAAGLPPEGPLPRERASYPRPLRTYPRLASDWKT